MNTFIFLFKLHRKNDFAELSKNLPGYRSENNFVKSSKIYIERLSIDDNTVKSFNILATNFSILHSIGQNYFQIYSRFS